VGLAGAAGGQNLIVNPSFDDTDLDGNFGDGWGTFGAADLVDFFGDDNPGHGFLFGDQPGNTGGVFQSGHPRDSEGQEYLFSIRGSLRGPVGCPHAGRSGVLRRR
jgi:hypothetical protein